MVTLALIVAAGIVILAVLHVYWALGGTWPGHDQEELAQLVVGGPTGLRMPSAAACAAVTVALAAAATFVLAAQGILVLPLPSTLVHAATYGVAGVLTVRGALGFFETRLRPVVIGTPYARLNVIAYSPLALALGLGTFAVVL